ncbi:hypothetical protein HNY73_000690 [Argiope bruennichi]|uniref:Uncharacterized protein n=1 Tax=Argiope bruennichi TaxID=94029 RepID=A0A8T0FZV5_ARGBR|nr:hypothetical protein HNY73_000690 [Argiope bruennichi]
MYPSYEPEGYTVKVDRGFRAYMAEIENDKMKRGFLRGISDLGDEADFQIGFGTSKNNFQQINSISSNFPNHQEITILLHKMTKPTQTTSPHNLFNTKRGIKNDKFHDVLRSVPPERFLHSKLKYVRKSVDATLLLLSNSEELSAVPPPAGDVVKQRPLIQTSKPSKRFPIKPPFPENRKRTGHSRRRNI